VHDSSLRVEASDLSSMFVLCFTLSKCLWVISPKEIAIAD